MVRDAGVARPGDVERRLGRLETFEVTAPKPPPPGPPPSADEDKADNDENNEPAPPPEMITLSFPVWLPPGYDSSEDRYPVVYMHHPRARQAGGWVAALDRVVGRTVEPLIVVFLETQPRKFSEIFLGSVVPAIDARYRTRADRDSRANVGMGFEANGAIRATFSASDTFGRLGSRATTGSTCRWTPVGRDRRVDGGRRGAQDLLRMGQMGPAQPPRGDEHAHGVAGALRVPARARLEPMGGEVADSTDFASWSNRTGLLLEALFPLDGKTPPASLARWVTANP